jgi:imidazolonepropionase-like amidohydrolase
MATIIIRAGMLVDGLGNPPLKDGVVVIKGNKIVGVHQGAVPGGAADEADVIDLGDAVLLPGLVCCHAHLNLPGDGTLPWDYVKEGEGVLAITSSRNAKNALMSGVTTLRDSGGLGRTTFDLRRTIELGYAEGPRLVLCGQPVTITGGHCHYFGGEADGVEGVVQKIRQLCKAGADYIKVMGTGGGSPGSLSWRRQYSREEMAAMTAEAHRAGRKIAVHCLSAEAMVDATETGADQIEHAGFFTGPTSQEFDSGLAQRVGATGVFASATNCVSYYTLKALEAKETLLPHERDLIDYRRRMLDQNLYQVGRLSEAGVRFVAGPDCGWLWTTFDCMADEVYLLQQAGLSTLEAISAATGRAAEALGVQSQVGALKPGLLADIIAVNKHALDDLRKIRDVNLVMKDGSVLSCQA